MADASERHHYHCGVRVFGLGLESGRHGVPPLPKLRPDGWDCHFPADVKDHAPQDVTLGTQFNTPVPWGLLRNQMSQVPSADGGLRASLIRPV